MNPVSIRLLSQQLVAPQYSRPEEVVAHFGAIQAQEYRMMRWAVGMRTRRPSEASFTKAFNEGKIVRLHLLRGTWQLVAAEDHAWMLMLTAPKAKQVISGWMSSNKIVIPKRELLSVRELLVDVAQRSMSSTREDFEAALAEQGIMMDSHRLSYHIRFAELDGVLCSGDLLPMKATYALTSRKLGTTAYPQSGIDRDEALKLLAQKYFQSHQPATLEDFAWWSGLGICDCRRGISLLGSSLHEERCKGRSLYLLDGCRTRGFRKGATLLIPPYDEYLIGYKSRDLVLAPHLSHHAHNNSGIFQPVIANDGHICGNWSPFAREKEAFSIFDPEHAPADPSSLDEAWSAFTSFRNH